MYIEGEIPAVTTNGNNGTNFVYPYPPMYGYGNGGFGGGFGGDWGWIILLLLLVGNNGWGNNGFMGGGNNMLYDINANTNRGFDNLALNSGIDSLQTTVSNGFANAQVQNCNSTNSLLQAINGINSNFQNCCCENRLATADLKYTIATEECATRNNASMNTRDIIESQNRGVQVILDKLNAQTLEAKNDEIAQLRQEVLFARGQASQIAQNEQIVNSIYNRLDTCPVGTTPVYGRTPIFTCPGSGCGCGSIQ